jgi:hypothetical protein
MLKRCQSFLRISIAPTVFAPIGEDWTLRRLTASVTILTRFLLARTDSTPSYTPCLFLCQPFPASFTSPWRWRKQGPPKRWYPTASLHSVTIKKATTFISSPCCTDESHAVSHIGVSVDTCMKSYVTHCYHWNSTAEENIWTWRRGSNRRMEKSTSWGAS